MMGIIPLLANHILDEELIHGRLPAFEKRIQWFLDHRKDLFKHIAALERKATRVTGSASRAATRDRLERVLKYMLDENEFLSPFGVRSMIQGIQCAPIYIHRGWARLLRWDTFRETWIRRFWRQLELAGPVWMPNNYLLIEALQKYHRFYGDDFTIECPTGSGNRLTLDGVRRNGPPVAYVFSRGWRPRPCHGTFERFRDDPHWRDYVLFPSI